MQVLNKVIAGISELHGQLLPEILAQASKSPAPRTYAAFIASVLLLFGFVVVPLGRAQDASSVGVAGAGMVEVKAKVLEVSLDAENRVFMLTLDKGRADGLVLGQSFFLKHLQLSRTYDKGKLARVEERTSFANVKVQEEGDAALLKRVYEGVFQVSLAALPKRAEKSSTIASLSPDDLAERKAALLGVLGMAVASNDWIGMEKAMAAIVEQPSVAGALTGSEIKVCQQVRDRIANYLKLRNQMRASQRPSASAVASVRELPPLDADLAPLKTSPGVRASLITLAQAFSLIGATEEENALRKTVFSMEAEQKLVIADQGLEQMPTAVGSSMKGSNSAVLEDERDGPLFNGPTQGKAWLVPDVLIEMTWIPPGSFIHGSSEDEDKRSDDEGPCRKVMVQKGYWIGKFEVTRKQWCQVMGGLGDLRPQDYQIPISNIKWGEANEFCIKLQAREKAAARVPRGYTYALPSEVLWEYAAKEARLDYVINEHDIMEQAHYRGTLSGKTELAIKAIGSKAPNSLGIYDLLGNVLEWCSNSYTEKLMAESDQSDGNSKAVKGGSYKSVFRECRPSERFGNYKDFARVEIGMRLCLIPSSDK